MLQSIGVADIDDVETVRNAFVVGRIHPISQRGRHSAGDFRRTHESESHQELRAAFNEDQWEAIMGVGAQASYFT